MFISHEEIRPLPRKVTAETITCDSRGHFLYLRSIVGLRRQYGCGSLVRPEELSEKTYQALSIQERFASMCDIARQFYRNHAIERPGMLSLQIGMSGVNGVRLFDPDDRSGNEPKKFLDSAYDDEINVTVGEFLSQDGGTKTLFDRITYAFDVATPEGQ